MSVKKDACTWSKGGTTARARLFVDEISVTYLTTREWNTNDADRLLLEELVLDRHCE